MFIPDILKKGVQYRIECIDIVKGTQMKLVQRVARAVGQDNRVIVFDAITKEDGKRLVSSRLHWLTSYPKSFGLLQARTMIGMIWSGVKTDGAPGRFLSDRTARISSSSFSGSSISILRKAGSAARNRLRQVATLL